MAKPLDAHSRKTASAHACAAEKQYRNCAKYRVATAAVIAGLMTSGCSATVAGALSFADMSTGLSLVSMAFTGKGLGEHAMDVITGKDCRFVEGVFRNDREICEERNSVATKEDFKGVVAWLSIDEADKPQEQVTPTAVASLETETTGLSAGASAQDIQVSELSEIQPAAGIAVVSLHTSLNSQPSHSSEKEWTVEELAVVALPRLKAMDADNGGSTIEQPVPEYSESPLEQPNQIDLKALSSIAPAAGGHSNGSHVGAEKHGIEMTMLGTPVAPSAIDLPEVRALF